VKGGREGRPVDAKTLATVVEKLGAGEILLNCMHKDGTNSGYGLELTKMVKEAVTIPVIASSGAGRVEHFSEIFEAYEYGCGVGGGHLAPRGGAARCGQGTFARERNTGAIDTDTISAH